MKPKTRKPMKQKPKKTGAMRAFIQNAMQKFGLSEADARYLAGGFTIKRTSHAQRLQELIQHGKAQQVKALIGQARQGKIFRMDIFRAVQKERQQKYRRLVKGKAMRVRNEQELMQVPKSVFGFALQQYKKEKRLRYQDILILVKQRLQAVRASAMVFTQFEQLRNKISEKEGKVPLNKAEWKRQVQKFWTLVNANT